jgi:GT2 family glycosyltransferase
LTGVLLSVSRSQISAGEPYESTVCEANQVESDSAMTEESTGFAQTTKIRLVVLLTCFNRREKTLECLRALASCTGLEAVQLRAVLVDDGSTDGTSQAVSAEFPWVEVVVCEGGLFWCRGMNVAFNKALGTGFDFYLWLNDDTTLEPDAVARMLACSSELKQRIQNPAIVVGNTLDPTTGAHTYGGERRLSRSNQFKFERVAPPESPQQCDTFTGNIVLISAEVASRVGNLDPGFEHAMGDTDYGLRARKLGVELWIAPGSHGTCSHNPVSNTYMDASLPLSERWKRMLHRKGLPWRSWLIFTRRHTGVMWPLYFAWPYLKLILGRPFAATARRVLPF